jgi:N-acetylated-alpha-linked acidic dipeptidase
VLPISYGDALPLLKALEGPVAPEGWRGALPITYRIGPSREKVHLQLAFNWDLKPVRDVVATMRGTDEPDVWVIRANHYDGWVNGAEDPISGQVALLEEARALGQLAQAGWKPKRTIIYISWDGEEPMLLGSTEWAETHADELKKHAAVYINSDSNGRGYISAGGSHTLESLVNQVARSIEDPETKATAWKRWQAADLLYGDADAKKAAEASGNLRIGALGSGSDYSAFIDHLGIASLDVSYAGEDDGGIYHSIYDDFYWYTHFSDTDFKYGRALAQTDGTLVLRVAQADLLPYDFAAQADTLHIYAGELKALLDSRRSEAKERKAALDLNAYALTVDPKRPLLAPPALETPPYLNFAPLDNALTALDKAAARYTKARDAAVAKSASGSALSAINAELTQAERKLTSPDGLPRRPWMQHLIYAPGWYTGYGAKTMPGPREALEERRYGDVDGEIARVARVIEDEAAFVEHVSGELEALSGGAASSGEQ